ncbi:MAG: hypothetical protein K2P93_05985 [Alphaproteobacteria bacterium]|nr:hypothetical protein [Alphaproteobacteria bacterium]
MNFKKLTYLFTFLVLFNQQCFANLPEDDVPEISQQIRLYKEAFKPFNKAEFESVRETTHIPGLVPILRIGFSYVRQLLGEDKDQLEILRTFWNEAKNTISEEKLTLRKFDTINTQFSFLLAEKKTKSYYFNDVYKNISPNNEWKESKNFESLLRIFPYPFCFEATLYSRLGIIPFEDFFDAYWETNDLTLGLISLAEEVKGPHGGLFFDSVAFRGHDKGHWLDFRRALKKDPSIWSQLKLIMKTILEARSDTFNKASAFLCTHELEPKVQYAKEDFPLSNEDLIKDKLPFSDRSIFKNWINDTSKRANRLVDRIVSNPVKKLFEDLTIEKETSQINIKVKIQEQIDQDTFKLKIQWVAKEKRNLEKKYENVAEAIVTVKFQDTSEDPLCNFLTISNLEILTMSKICPLQEKLPILKDTVKEVKEGRRFFQYLYLNDMNSLINEAYGQEVFPKNPKLNEIKAIYRQFLSDFYEKNKSALSDDYVTIPSNL